MILVTILISGVMACLFFHFTCSNQEPVDNSMVIFMTFGMFCNQGIYILPNSMNAKLAIWWLLFAGLVLNASYSANLTSFLFVKKVKVPFTDLQSLASNTDYKVGSVAGSNWQAYLRDHTDASVKKLYKSRYLSVNSVSEAVEKMLQDSHFVFGWSQDAVYYQIEDSCLLQSVAIKAHQATFYMRKGFPYKEIIDKQ